MTSVVALNGWTAARLDDLAADVAGIHATLEKMHSQELQDLKAELKDLKAELKEARERPRARLVAYLAPVIPSLITILYLILSSPHA